MFCSKQNGLIHIYRESLYCVFIASVEAATPPPMPTQPPTVTMEGTAIPCMQEGDGYIWALNDNGSKKRLIGQEHHYALQYI